MSKQTIQLFILQSTLFLFILFSSSIASADNGNDKTKALLWEITGNGLKQPSYVFGTIHAVCPEEFEMPVSVKDRLQKAAQLSLEIDMDAPELMAELQKGLVLPNGGSLKSLYSEEDYQILADYFSTNMGFPLQQLDMLKPFTLQSMLLSQLTECKAVVYEMKLMELAHAQDKEVIGVETVAEQISAIDKLPLQVQAAMLLKTVKEMDTAKANYRNMVKLYKEQDLQGLEAAMQQDFTPEEYQSFEEALLVNRNKRWIPVMEREIKNKSTFFAVGAAHLPGKNGLLELLQNQGYTVKPILN